MQVACEVRRVLRKNPEQILVEQFKLPFVNKKVVLTDKESQVLTDDKLAIAKGHWGSMIGMSQISTIQISQDEIDAFASEAQASMPEWNDEVQ